jgi:hypothetical protein
MNKINFINFLESLNENITNNINVENYFKLPKTTQYNILISVYKNILNFNQNNFDDLQLIQINFNYSTKNQNYELAAILKEIITNYDSLKNIDFNIKKLIIVNKLDDEIL